MLQVALDRIIVLFPQTSWEVIEDERFCLYGYQCSLTDVLQATLDMLSADRSLPSVHVLHGLDLCLAELALVLVVLLALPVEQPLPVLVQLQLGHHHLAGVNAHIHCGACTRTAPPASAPCRPLQSSILYSAVEQQRLQHTWCRSAQNRSHTAQTSCLCNALQDFALSAYSRKATGALVY
jgi:hypothetical protein